MQVELKVNDKSVRVEMTEKQLKELGLIEEQRTGYERVKKVKCIILSIYIII